MTRIVRASVTSTNSATTARTINTTNSGLLPHDERRGALDFDHVDGRPLGDLVAVDERASRPLLPADPDTAAVDVDLPGDDGATADERGRAGPRDDGDVQVRPSDRPQDGQREHRAHEE